MGFVRCDTFTGLYCFYKNGTRTPGNHLRETWWCSSWHCCDLRAGQAQSDEADQRLETRRHSWRLNVAPQWDVETWFSDLDSSWNIIGNGPQNLVWTLTIYPRDKSTPCMCQASKASPARTGVPLPHLGRAFTDVQELKQVLWQHLGFGLLQLGFVSPSSSLPIKNALSSTCF